MRRVINLFKEHTFKREISKEGHAIMEHQQLPSEKKTIADISTAETTASRIGTKRKSYYHHDDTPTIQFLREHQISIQATTAIPHSSTLGSMKEVLEALEK
jgi:hypothetical protein